MRFLVLLLKACCGNPQATTVISDLVAKPPVPLTWPDLLCIPNCALSASCEAGPGRAALFTCSSYRVTPQGGPHVSHRGDRVSESEHKGELAKGRIQIRPEEEFGQNAFLAIGWKIEMFHGSDIYERE